jgi:hypothetical protein
MEERPERLEKIATTDHTQQLPPGPPLGWPLARRLPQPTQPRYAQAGFGQKWVEVSTWRRRPRVGMMRGGGVRGASEWGALACAQASQCGFVMKPLKG